MNTLQIEMLKLHEITTILYGEQQLHILLKHMSRIDINLGIVSHYDASIFTYRRALFHLNVPCAALKQIPMANEH